jgi:hypothetical protein
MTDHFELLEMELRALRPRAPSAGMMRSLARDLETARSEGRRPRRPWAAWPWGNAAVAGGLLALAVTASWVRPTPWPAAKYEPVAATRYLLEDQDQGIVTLADGTLARQVREVFVDQLTWRSAGDGAVFEVTLPRAEVRLQPVAWY